MSLPPDLVPIIQDIAADARKIARRCEALLREVGPAGDEPCIACGGKGVIEEFGERYGGPARSFPCDCAKGAPFRIAAAAQRKGGRDRQVGERNE